MAHQGPDVPGRFPASPSLSSQETARLKAIFSGMHDPAEVHDVPIGGMSPEQLRQLLPAYDESAANPMYGIFVNHRTGKAHAFQSGLGPGSSSHGSIEFRRGLLRRVEIENSNAAFISLEAHIEAQVAAFMRKEEIAEGTLVLNGMNPCLGPAGCNDNLPILLPPGSRLWVRGTGMHGVYNGLADE